MPSLATISRSAQLSLCGTYRWELRRWWSEPGHQPERVLGWIMLNPSTADGHEDDPTIRRCVAFAKTWGYDGIVVRNLYALRATNPTELWQHRDPVGDSNGAYLTDCAADALTVCAWGAHGERHNRGRNIRAWMNLRDIPLHHLGLTKSGQPRHPLYLPGSLTPTPWPAASSVDGGPGE